MLVAYGRCYTVDGLVEQDVGFDELRPAMVCPICSGGDRIVVARCKHAPSCGAQALGKPAGPAEDVHCIKHKKDTDPRTPRVRYDRRINKLFDHIMVCVVLRGNGRVLAFGQRRCRDP
jgi:hypothetical protein